MPVALRRGGSRLQGAEVDTELGQAACSTEPLARAPLHRPVERRRIIRRLVERQLVDIDFWHFCFMVQTVPPAIRERGRGEMRQPLTSGQPPSLSGRNASLAGI